MKLIIVNKSVEGEIGSKTDDAQRFHYKGKWGEIVLQMQLGRTLYLGYLKGETEIFNLRGEKLTGVGQINTWIRNQGEGFVVKSLAYIEVAEKQPGSKLKMIDYVYSLKEMVSAVEFHTGFKLSD